MPDTVIKVENLSKLYRIGATQERHDTLRDAVTGPFRRRPPSLVLRPSDTNLWALRDVSFEVKQGEAVGIIGRNGAGKSTLLKILSRITEPTNGRVALHGRVASLLEVGTGFHPELTGRENVYLNGAILGMRRREIERKFDEIMAFAEIERFLDTPVKRYSSGMYVRLAFAVAAHLEPEILLVDEVLAVGDAQFQKKCLGKMGEAARGGRTVLFVSHNLAAISRLCSRSLWIDAGTLRMNAFSASVVSDYQDSSIEMHLGEVDLPPSPSKEMSLRKISILDCHGRPSSRVEMGEPILVQLEYDINRPVTGSHIVCFFHTSEGINVFGTGDADDAPDRLDRREAGTYKAEFAVPRFLLGEGRYAITVSMGIPYVHVYDRHEGIVGFEVFDSTSERGRWQHNRRPGILGIELPWTVEKVT